MAFFARTDDEWVERLSRLIEDKELRKGLGIAGGRTVEERFSLKVNVFRFLEIIKGE